MNERMNQLINECFIVTTDGNLSELNTVKNIENFAVRIIEDARRIIEDEYRDTPLELCGPLLSVDEKISEHFYRIE